jgi:outer membrane lipoprotein SlyB
MKCLPWILAVMLLASCATQPVVVAREGQQPSAGAAPQADVDACLAEAKQAVESDRAKEVAANTAEGAVVGGAVGAATGAVLGQGRGAGAGAAGGAAGGFVRSMLRWNDPDPVEKGYVNRCLRKRGYDVLGWR